MKTAVRCFALLAALAVTGCIFGRHKQPRPPTVVNLTATNAPTANTFTITPDQSITGRVTLVNPNLRFVVLTFPLGQIPPVGSRMNVFRNSAIVGEISITGPAREDNTVADIIFGEAQKGDEVRAK
ncbi:MAG TPA: hypothetical protein VN873_17630 [Candidatus Angelobacter sp.]|nr:hypothetical protein [Candidatus Angelobacter sp.]